MLNANEFTELSDQEKIFELFNELSGLRNDLTRGLESLTVLEHTADMLEKRADQQSGKINTIMQTLEDHLKSDMEKLEYIIDAHDKSISDLKAFQIKWEGKNA